VVLAERFAQLAQDSADALLILTASEITMVEFVNGFAEGSGQTRLGADLPFPIPRKFAVPRHGLDLAFQKSVKPVCIARVWVIYYPYASFFYPPGIC